MGTMGKVIGGLVVAVLVAAVLAITLLVNNLDDIIRQVVETTGSEVTGTAVTLDSAKLTLTDGRGELQGLSIGNPPGYSSPNAFAMQQIALQIDPLSITGDVIVINEVLVDGAVLTAEQKGLNTNLKDLLNNIEAAAGPPPASKPAEEDPAANIRLMVEKFSFVNSSATVVTEQWGEKSLDVPNIVMNDIGDKETGLTPQELANIMTKTLMKRTETAVTKYLEKLAKDAGKKELEKQLDKNLSDDDKAKLKGIKSMFDK
jgi:uncharacterized protein involved in outer membrane biogenesis